MCGDGRQINVQRTTEGFYSRPCVNVLIGRPKGGPEHPLQLLVTVIVPHKKLW